MYVELVFFTDISCHKTDTLGFPFPSPFPSSSPRKFQDAGTGLYLSWYREWSWEPSLWRYNSTCGLRTHSDKWQLPVRLPSRCAAWPALCCDTVWFGVAQARTSRLCDTLTTTPLSYSTVSLPSSALWNHSTLFVNFLPGLNQHNSPFTKYTVVTLRDRGQDQWHRDL